MQSGCKTFKCDRQLSGRIPESEPVYILSVSHGTVERASYLPVTTLIDGWFAGYTSNYNDFIKALFRNNLEEMNAYMNRVTQETFSSFDSGKHPSGEMQPERFYHGFVLGLLVDLRERYILTSNRESGLGRYDIMLEPLHKDDDAFILEFKVFNPKKENVLEDTVQSALKQIKEKKYAASLIARGISEDRIHSYGFAFQGKTVLIR